jgi:hypothetical protein
MKRFWLVLLSLGLVVAFSASAFAVDVKFSGEFYAAGMYLDKTTLKKDTGTDGPSTAFYYQRLRVKTDFVVSPGLTLVTRFDAMERAWGAARTAPGTALDTQSQGTTAENENIAFDMAYVMYTSPIGTFSVGYQPEATWGTVFGNSSTSVGKISYTLPVKDFTLILQLVKAGELSKTAKYASTMADSDANAFYLMMTYKLKQGIIGLANFASRNAMGYTSATPALQYKQTIPLQFVPFMNVQLGPVNLQSEFTYQRGKREYQNGQKDADISAMSGWVDATADFKLFYVGGTFAYASGDDPGTTDKIEGGTLTGGNDWNPCLIMWNYDRAYWAGALAGYDAANGNGAAMTNAFFYQLRAGVRPIDKLDLMASVSFANADKKPTAYQNANYGWEADVTGTYKITNNLSYMLGFGYLFTGNYYKGTTAYNVQNDYIVMNKLTLTF